MPDLPAITGIQLIDLLNKDGWATGRKSNHGRSLKKKYSNRTRVTFIPEIKCSLPTGTLHAILSQKQTGIGKDGLERLIKKYGLK